MNRSDRDRLDRQLKKYEDEAAEAEREIHENSDKGDFAGVDSATARHREAIEKIRKLQTEIHGTNIDPAP